MVDIVIIDDHEILREGVVELLRKQQGFHIVAQGGTGYEAEPLVNKHKPHILLLDISMPESSGFQVLPIISEYYKGTKVIVLSSHDDEATIARALKYGACGYLSKDEASDVLIEAINEVMLGQRYLSPSFGDGMLQRLEELLESDDGSLVPLDRLTQREREILQLSAEGLTYLEIAAKLNISSRTVETHRFNFMRKLNLKSQTDVVRFAIENRIIS